MAPEPASLTDAARQAFEQLDALHDLTRFVLRDLDQFPDLLMPVVDRLLDGPIRLVAQRARAVAPAVDSEAVATLLVGALVNFKVIEALGGRRPGAVEQERIVAGVGAALSTRTGGRVSDLDLALDATAQAELVATGAVSARLLIEETLLRIEQIDAMVGAFRVVLADAALAPADRIDARRRRESEVLPLLGVPVAIKDDTDVVGQVTAWGSTADREAARADAAVVGRLPAAGAIVIGKTNVPELTLWPWTASERWGVTRNPWNPERSRNTATPTANTPVSMKSPLLLQTGRSPGPWPTNPTSQPRSTRCSSPPTSSSRRSAPDPHPGRRVPGWCR